MAKRGRKSTYNQTKVDEICLDIETSFISVEGACGSAGVLRRTFDNWLARPELSEIFLQLTRARSIQERKLIIKVVQAIDDCNINGSLALELLSRQHPHWRKNEKKEIFHTVAHGAISGFSDLELQAFMEDNA